MARKKQPKDDPPPDDHDDGDEAPGWHAIDEAMLRLYPAQSNPPHFAPTLSPVFSEDELIYGVSGYKADDPAHWHMVTYGFSELYAKESDDPTVSGWGFELTLRLPRKARDKQPPAWAINFLFNLGRYVLRSRNPFGDGHAMDLNGPICVGADTAIRAIAFTTDSQLGTIDTPNGRVEFLQVVGLTPDEHQACGDWHTGGVLEILRETDALLITDLARRSAFEDSAAAARLEEGIDRDGSQSEVVYVSVVDWKTDERTNTATATLGAKGVQTLVPRLRSRLLHGRRFLLIGREKVVGFCPAKKTGWQVDDEALLVDVTAKAVRAMMQTLKPVRGTYTWKELPGFTLVVVPTEITDAEGAVTEVIG